MKEYLDLRVPLAEARMYLPPEAGKDSGPCRELLLDVKDPLVEKLRALEQEYQARGTTLFTRCLVRRRYTPRELRESEWLLVAPLPPIEPTGQQCGTLYDTAHACPFCGAGEHQAAELRLDLKRLPRGRDFVQTLGGELLVSSRLASAMQAHGITGMELAPVVGLQGERSQDWHQLSVPSHSLEVAPLTLVGQSYFAPEPDPSRCPRGHVLGFRLLSQLSLSRSSLNGKDWGSTRQFLGLRQGLFRPNPLLIISQRLYRLLLKLKVKRYEVEAIRLVS